MELSKEQVDLSETASMVCKMLNSLDPRDALNVLGIARELIECKARYDRLNANKKAWPSAYGLPRNEVES